MSGKSGKPSRPVSHTVETVKKHIIPVQLTEGSLFDDNLANMKRKFEEEMKRVNEQMLALGMALTKFYSQGPTVQALNEATATSGQGSLGWDVITSSPLVTEKDGTQMLRLQFDVSQFSPSEVEVIIRDNMLTISAVHDEKTDTTNVHRELTRSFPLPVGTTPTSIESSLSQDGVLIIQAPLIKPIAPIPPAAPQVAEIPKHPAS